MQSTNGLCKNVASIEKSIDLNVSFKSVTERYYTKRYFVDKDGEEDHCIMFHSNRICLVTLAEGHPVLKGKKSVAKIDFQVSTKVDRMKNKVSGKGKHGAQCLQSSSPLCFIECEDGSKFTVKSCLKGKLVEMNDNLVDNPNLLVTKPYAEGYIAIVLPNISSSEEQKKEMLSYEEYREILNVRSQVDL